MHVTESMPFDMTLSIENGKTCYLLYFSQFMLIQLGLNIHLINLVINMIVRHNKTLSKIPPGEKEYFAQT